MYFRYLLFQNIQWNGLVLCAYACAQYSLSRNTHVCLLFFVRFKRNVCIFYRIFPIIRFDIIRFYSRIQVRRVALFTYHYNRVNDVQWQTHYTSCKHEITQSKKENFCDYIYCDWHELLMVEQQETQCRMHN